MTDAIDEEQEMVNLLAHIRGTLLYCEEMQDLESIRKIALLCVQALSFETAEPEKPSTCQHEPDPRFGPSDTYIQPGQIEAWRYPDGPQHFGEFVCRKCSASFIAGYSYMLNNRVETVEDLVLLQDLGIPDPVHCPDCDGTGKVDPQPRVNTLQNQEYKSTSCELCFGYGWMDPEKREEILAKRLLLDKALD